MSPPSRTDAEGGGEARTRPLPSAVRWRAGDEQPFAVSRPNNQNNPLTYPPQSVSPTIPIDGLLAFLRVFSSRFPLRRGLGGWMHPFCICSLAPRGGRGLHGLRTGYGCLLRLATRIAHWCNDGHHGW